MPPSSPLLRTLGRYAVRYGPLLLAVARQVQGPAQDAARTAWEARRAARTASEHALTLRQGTVLDVVHAGRRHWVVFSGDEAVTAYPPTDVPLLTLVLHADTERRRAPTAPAPGDAGASRLRQLARRRAARGPGR